MLSAGLDAVVVVTRTELLDTIDLPQDHRLLVVINDDASSQMLDSIRLGLNHLNDVRNLPADAGILVIPADMPTVSPEACRRCVEAFRENPSRIVIVTCDGKRGHPIIFSATLCKMLDEMDGGLNELPRVRADLVHEVAIADQGVLRDIDTPADYDKLDA